MCDYQTTHDDKLDDGKFGTTHFDKLDDENFDVNTQDKTGRTLLFVACRICDEVRVKQLVTLGCDPNIVDNFGHTCLTVACAISTITPNKLKIIKYLLEDIKMNPYHITAKCGQTYMHIACKGGYLDVVTYLNTTYPDLINILNLEDQSCLITAIIAKHSDVVQYLLKVGMDPNEMNEENGLTCLMIACLKKKYDIVQQLVQAGADINEYNHKNKNALYYAAIYMSGNYDTILFLLEKGSGVDERILKQLDRSTNVEIRKYLKENETEFMFL
jgi:ankyrin repeat protein